MYDIYNPAANTVQFSAQSSALAPYRDEYEHALIDDWDGAGAVAVAPQVLEQAEKLIDEFGTTENLVEVTPGRDGSLAFIWEDKRGSYIYLDVGPGNTLHLYHDVVGQPKWEGVSVANDPRILRELSLAFRKTDWRLCQMVVISIRANTGSRRSALARAIA